MTDNGQKDSQNIYSSSEISGSITAAIGNVEQVIDILIEKSYEKAREEAQIALLEYRAKIEQISQEITKNVSQGSARISESINQAIKRKVEKESSTLSSIILIAFLLSVKKGFLAKSSYDLAMRANNSFLGYIISFLFNWLMSVLASFLSSF